MITVIGDAHGKFDQYYKIASKAEYSLCLGDFGFRDSWNKLHSSSLSSDHHKIIPGNHDDYDTSPNSDYCLGNFGVAVLNGTKFFFIRGGISIDRVYRLGEELCGGPKTYWSQEELNFTQMLECMRLYESEKPDVVFSHVPPAICNNEIHGNKHNILHKFKFHDGFAESTGLLGDELLKIHKPSYWWFGHHHRSWSQNIGGTNFRCLAELESADFDYEKEVKC